MKEAILFGGSFNPPHIGHQKIIEALSVLHQDKKILVCPAYVSPFKKRKELIINDKERIEKLEKLINKIENKNITIITDEIKKRKTSYTIDTLKTLNDEYRKISLAIGQDSYSSLHRWEEINEIFKIITKCYIIPRGTEKKIKNENLWKLIEKSYKIKIEYINMKLLNISSSEIRKKI